MARPLRLILGGIGLSSLLLAGCPSPPSRSTAPARPEFARDEPHDPAAWVERLVDLHNQVRRERGLPSLEIDPHLQRAAEQHAEDMARRRRMSHRGSDFSTPFDRMARAGYVYRSAAENVAYGQKSPEEALDDWMHSPPHRRAILGKFSQIGAACAIASDGTFAWCVTFGDPKDG